MHILIDPSHDSPASSALILGAHGESYRRRRDYEQLLQLRLADRVDLSTLLVLVASRSSWASGCARAENHCTGTGQRCLSRPGPGSHRGSWLDNDPNGCHGRS